MEQLQDTLSNPEGDIALFLREFRLFEEKARLRYINEEKDNFSAFFNGFQVAEDKQAAQFELHAPNFNLFHILKIAHLEDTVHSPILANLFSPQGTHGQKDLFIHLLFQHLYGEMYEASISDVDVRVEYGTYGGIFDLFITCMVEGKLFYIVIENKIYAIDQHRQMERYYSVLKKSFLVEDNFLLIYLTPDGRRPHPESMNVLLQEELIHSNHLYCLSYRHDIAALLTRSLEIIKAPVVRETVKQYLQTIKRL